MPVPFAYNLIVAVLQIPTSLFSLISILLPFQFPGLDAENNGIASKHNP